MKILNKIRAFFKFKGETQQMELSAAEIRNKGVFLHPIDDPKHVFFVKSKAVDIFINNNEELQEDDISIIDKETIKTNNTEGGEKFEDNEDNKVIKRSYIRPLSYVNYMPSKKRFSIMLYQDEYDMLMNNIKEHGYKKAEYFLACVQSAKKQSFESTYKKYTEEHKKRYKADAIKAKKVKEDNIKTNK